MHEPIVINCQCEPSCSAWILVQHADHALLEASDARIVVPSHAHSDDQIREVRSGYLIVSPRTGAESN
jgi:hypothetical protein